MRLKANEALDRLAEPQLCDNHPPHRCYHALRYRAKSWSAVHRVVPVIDPVPGQLFPRHYYLITNLNAEAYPAAQLVKLYRKNGTMEKHFGEMNAVCSMALSSVARSKSHCQGRPVVREPDESKQEDEIRAENSVLLPPVIAHQPLVTVRKGLLSVTLQLAHRNALSESVWSRGTLPQAQCACFRPSERAS